MKKHELKFNADPYSKIFGEKSCESSRTGRSANQLLAFTAYFDVQGNGMTKEELLDCIVDLSPSPHGIFPDDEGYLLRFELLEPIDIADDKHEDKLIESILKFLVENAVAHGELQELEIGRWETHLSIPVEDGEVRE